MSCIFPYSLSSRVNLTYRLLHNSFKSASTSSCVNLAVDPNPSMIDDRVRIKVTGLSPKAAVTLQLSVDRPSDKLDFRSRSLYVSSDSGEVDVGSAEALDGGSYTGLDAMGPFWSMRPSNESNGILQTTDIEVPLNVSAELYAGHHGPTGSNIDHAILMAKCAIERRIIAPGVRRIPIVADGIHSILFLPAAASSNQSVPLINVIYGGVVRRGHLKEERAALYAAKGFAALAVGIFGMPGLPKMYQDIEIETLEKTIDHVLNSYEVIDPNRIGMHGISKGGDITLSCAAFLQDKIKAAVIQNACICSIAGRTSYGGRVVEMLDFHPEKARFRKDGSVDPIDMLSEPAECPNSVIPFADCPADLLFLAAEDDHNFQSAKYARIAEDMFRDSGKKNYEILYAKGTGHLCNAPYSPGVFVDKHPIMPGGLVYMGAESTPAEHNRGQVAFWNKANDFFRRTLRA